MPLRPIVPPRAAFAVAGPLGAAVVVGGLAAASLGGPGALAAFVLGAGIAAPAALHGPRTSWLPWVVGLIAAGWAAAAVGSPNLIVTVVLVSGSALVQAPVNRRATGALMLLPVLVTFFTTAELSLQAWVVGAWVALGWGTLLGTAAWLDLPVRRETLPVVVAWRHAVLTAAGCGVIVWLAAVLRETHGYWAVAALVMVLQPVPQQAWPVLVERLLGTAAGACLSVLGVVLLPRWGVLGVAGVSLLLALGWAVAGDGRRQTVLATTGVILIGSAGLAGPAVDLAGARLVLFVAGGALAALLALVLLRVQTSTGDARPAPPDADGSLGTGGRGAGQVS